MINLSDLNLNTLKEMTKDDLRQILKQEWQTTVFNENYKWQFDELDNNELIIEVLNTYFLDRANIEFSNNNPNEPFKAKLNGTFMKKFKGQEDSFLDSIKLLLLNGYLQSVKIINEDYSELLNVDFSDEFYKGHLKQVVHERNFLWIFENHRELFQADSLAEEDDLILMEHHGLIFALDESAESIFNKMNSYGTIIDLLSTGNSVLSLSHKGMYLLQVDQYHKNQLMIEEQKRNIGSLDKARGELSTKIKETETKLSIIHNEMKEEFNNHKNKINLFYKDIAAILSILVAAFAVIGVNISAIPKIESNFAINVITLNVSLCLVLIIMFLILRKTVFLLPNSTKSNDKFWVLIIGVLLLFCGTLYMADVKFTEPSKDNNEYQNEIESLEQRIYEQNKRINEFISELQESSIRDYSLKEELENIKVELDNLQGSPQSN